MELKKGMSNSANLIPSTCVSQSMGTDTVQALAPQRSRTTELSSKDVQGWVDIKSGKKAQS